MSQLVTAALTAFFGVLVFVTGQFLQKFLLEPIQEQRKVVGEITYSLTYLAKVGPVPDNIKIGVQLLASEDPIVAAKTLRKLGGQLRSSLFTIPFYGLLARLGIVLKKEILIDVSTSMIGWSNSLQSGNPEAHRKRIAESLGVKY
jgi:hypothetical protein